MNFILPGIYRMTELHVVHAKLNSPHACKTSACIQLAHSDGVLGVGGGTWLLWQRGTLPTCHPENTLWLIGHSLRHRSLVWKRASQPPGCYLLLENCLAQQNWDVLKKKKKKGKKKSMRRDWMINSCSRNAWSVVAARCPSSEAPGSE